MIEPSGFREIARTVTVTYPIPFAFALLLAFAIIMAGGALLATPPLLWVLIGFAGASFLLGAGLFIGCAVWRPELLRSERQEIRNRVIDFIVDSDIGPETVELTRLVLSEAGTKKSSAQLPRAPGGHDAKR